MKDTSNRIPLYCKLADELEELINDEVYSVGSTIPSERELCDRYGVSRMTVRLAIEELERKGKVKKVQGKGTFVQSKSIIQNLGNLYSFSSEMEKQGKVSTTKVLKKEMTIADKEISKHLQIDEGERVVYLERLRCSDQIPVMIERTWFPYDKFDFLLDIDFTTRGLYRTLQDDYKVSIDRATENFRATGLNKNECELLNCSKGQYGLLVKRTTYTNDRVLSYSTIVSKGDIFEFTVNLVN